MKLRLRPRVRVGRWSFTSRSARVRVGRHLSLTAYKNRRNRRKTR